MAGQDFLSDGKLPGDVMVIILSNLPVKSLLKFKSVSKPWCSLISSPRFIQLHLHRQSLLPNNFLLSFDDVGNGSIALLTHNHDNINTANSDVLILENPPLLSPDETCLFIIDSCNGLVCLHTLGFDDRLILWNPATRKYTSLEPRPLKGGNCGLAYSTLGLCYVEATNDFKLAGCTYVDTPVDSQCFFVYSLSSGSWEKLDCDAKKTPIVFGHPTFMTGCMHWLAKTCTCSSECTCSFANVIVAFNVMDGVMSCFGVPDNCGHRSRTSRQTFVIRGCLSIAVFLEPQMMESEIEVWVMEGYGVEGSWVKQFTIQGLSQATPPLISWNDGEIVFMCDTEFSKRLTFYDPSSKEKYYLEFTSIYVYKVFNYVESLAVVEAEVEIAPYQLIEG